jgi:serine/threonine protein kinase
LVAAKIDLRKHGYRLGDIKPENVFIDEERRIKIVNILTSSNEKYAYDKAKDFENASLNVLLAP